MPFLSTRQLEFFHANGYLIVRQLLDAKTVEVLRGALTSIVQGQAQGAGQPARSKYPDGTQVTQFRGVWKSHPVFLDLMQRSNLGEAAAQLMDTREVRLLADQIFYKEPKLGGAVPCHQDYAYWRRISTSNIITAWMAISSVSRESGCMYMIPGSHRWGLFDNSGFDGMKDAVRKMDPELFLKRDLSDEQRKELTREPVLLEPGDVSFHHALVIHCSYANTSDGSRIGYIHRYLPAEARYVEAYDLTNPREIDVKNGELINTPRYPLVWPH